MADFFDLKRVPGKRMIRKDSQAMLEMALIADGVPLDKLYPLDVDRAIAKFATIKDCDPHLGHRRAKPVACCAMGRCRWAGCGTPAPRC